MAAFNIFKLFVDWNAQSIFALYYLVMYSYDGTSFTINIAQDFWYLFTMFVEISLSDACGPRGVCKCLLKLQKETVNCALQGLTDLPNGIPANVSTLWANVLNFYINIDEKAFLHIFLCLNCLHALLCTC